MEPKLPCELDGLTAQDSECSAAPTTQSPGRMRHLLSFPTLVMTGSLAVLAATDAGAQVRDHRLATCQMAKPDTVDWRTQWSPSLGLAIRVPASYVRMSWDSVSDSTDISMDLWYQGGPRTTIE